MLDHQSDGDLVVSGSQGMLDGFVDQAVAGKPIAGDQVQLSDPVRTDLFAQHVLEERLKQVMISEPIALVVQGNHEQVGVDQPLDKKLCI